MSKIRVTAISLLAFGLALHTYTSAAEATSFHIGFWLWSLSPYIVAAVLLLKFHLPHASVGAIAVPAILDAAMFYSAFISAQGSTVALGLLFVPFWNLVIFVPVGGLLGWRIGKTLREDSDRKVKT